MAGGQRLGRCKGMAQAFRPDMVGCTRMWPDHLWLGL